ncbi:BNR repeat-containing protein [Halosolutus gelatinilyticus]|uniref:BNR repeat-containing protein n=1 Tax=Halosolutus gelatinilyticus TaxID=2931975 RepID=UPI001FF6857A|nr:BNR repeat-containing protein [Halosolutus gelatinilyticus]
MAIDTNRHDNESNAEVSGSIGRRMVLATSSVFGVASLFGNATAGRNAAGGRDRSRPDALERYDLAENGLGNAQTDTPPFQPRLTTYNDRQYYAYWTQEGSLVVAARDLPDGEWVQTDLDVEIDVRDGHWTPGIGVGPDGHVFLNYNTRDSEIRWRQSTNPEDVRSFGEERVGMTGQNESSVTYLEFTRLIDGTLLAGYREGMSGAGNWMLNRWDPDTEAWEPLQHPLIDGEGEHNSYMWNLVQSEDGMLHYFFNWRETWNVQTNVDLSYARSADGGKTWERSDGTPYTLPITFGEAEIVDPIEPGSNFINQGWASYDPRTGAPHVTYYRDDENGHTQVFHAYLDDGEWVIESATNRTTDIDLGGPGVVASPIGRMGIVVDEDGDVHILTRDFEHGSWPLLVEKIDGEWRTSVLYKRNMTWSDVHIDPARWRADRVLSYVDHQQNVGDVPWSAHSLVGITDVDLERLNRSQRTIDLSEEPDELAVYASTEAVGPPISVASTSFEETNTALALTETTVPATPAYARATVALDESSGATVEARVKIQGAHGTTYGDPVEIVGDGTTHWTKVPQAFRAGFVTVQLRATPDGDEGAIVSETVLEIGYHDPTGGDDAVAPHGGESR